MVKSFANKILLSFLGPIVILMLLAVLTWRYEQKVSDSVAWVFHTHKVIAEVRNLGKFIVDLETGERGYIITGYSRFLEPYNAAQEQWQSLAEDLKILVDDNPQQVERVAKIIDLMTKWQTKAADPEIEARKKGDFDKARQLIASDTGKRLIDQIRVLIAEFVAVEKILMEQREKDLKSRKREFKLALLLGFVSISVMIFFAVLTIRRSAAEGLRMILDTTRKIREGESVSRISVNRTDEFGMIASDFNLMLDALDEQKKQVLHADRLSTIGELAAGVGHEINNPLTICNGQVRKMRKIMASTGISTEALEKSFHVYLQASKRITSIVRGLTDFSRTESSAVETFALNETIEETISILSGVLKADGIQLVSELTNNTILVHGNKGRIGQVIMNLLTNARDAVADKRNPTVVVSLENLNPNKARIIVKDNGVGIPESIGNRIFDGFFTTKPVGKGTGLGLSMCGKIVAEFNGKIDFKSEPGKGTEFFIDLPTMGGAKESETANSPAEFRLQSSLAVLVVDDEDKVRETILDYLHDMGCDVVDQASDGLIALEKINSGHFDVVLTDLKMPVIDGYELIKKISEMKMKKVPKVIILTGWGANHVAPTELSPWIFGTMSKPIDEKEFFHMISACQVRQDRPKSVA